MNFQTRSMSGQITFHQTLNDALKYAFESISKDPVWKISFTLSETDERVRLVHSVEGWILEDISGDRKIPTPIT